MWLRSRQGESRGDGSGKGAAKAALPPAKPAPPARRVNPHKLAEAEGEVAELEATLARIDAALADPAHHADAGRLVELGREREEIARRLGVAEERWLALLED